MDTDAKTYIYRSLDNVTEMQEKEKRYEMSPHMSSLKKNLKPFVISVDRILGHKTQMIE